MGVQAVVFDIGNVLLEWQPEAFYDREIGPERRRALMAEVPLAATNEAVDLGAPMGESIYALAEQFPHWAPEIRLWHDRWLEMASPPIPRSVRLLQALKAKAVPVFALTNFGVETFELARASFPFLDLFDQSFVSGQMGVMKPDPAIYAALEAGTGLSGGALLFTDDRADNIAAAAARGWGTHLFDHPQGWAERLVEEGLLRSEEAA